MATIKAIAISVTTDDDRETAEIARALVLTSAPMYSGWPRKSEGEEPKLLTGRDANAE